jgi:DNA-binding XRE family transcriptional regulator
MKTKAQSKSVAAKRVTVKGKRVVQLDEAEFDRLLQKADEWEPTLPMPDADGCVPAVEYALASLAREIIRDRRRLGLTQKELAQRAGIRLATLLRIESGRRRPSAERAIDKIDKALKESEARQAHSR